MPGITRGHATGVIAVTLAVAIAAAVMPRMTKIEDPYDTGSYRSWGPWYMTIENYDATGAGVKQSSGSGSRGEPYQCDAWYPGPGQPATDCSDALLAKCQVTQALSIIGPLCNLVATALVVARCGPAVLTPAIMFVAGCCYLVIWAVTAGLHHADTADVADSDCGYGGAQFQHGTVKYGACFVMYVVAWLLAWCSAVMVLLQRIHDLAVVPE